MKTIKLLILIFISLQLIGCSSKSNLSDQQNVIIVVIDGVRYSESFGSEEKNISYLYNDLALLGTVYTNFRIAEEGVTSTNPGQASILTGSWQLIANDGTENPDKPTVFEYYRKKFSAKESDCYVVAGKKKLEALSYSSFQQYGYNYKASTNCFDANTNNEIYDSLIVTLDTYHPRLILVNFPSTDKKAHAGNWDEYIAAIRNVDSLIYMLYNKIQTDPFYKNKTTLFITNDHGRHTNEFSNHGDDCDGCEHIMLLAVGKNFESKKSDNNSRYQIDICRTVGEIMNFQTPFATGSSLIEK